MSWIVRRVRPDEGLRLRALRLQALADTPSAFGSTLAREEAFAEAVWHERATRGALGEISVTYVAEESDRWVGMVTGLADEADEPRPALVGMFVEQAARGRGIGAALVEAVARWAGDRGAARLYLHVTSTNRAAIRLYTRCGFWPTGETQPLDHTPSLTEVEMVRDVEPGGLDAHAAERTP
ncbi:MAG TPA: GNAT family N-acetyltransferase [Methylomirabilota bacterium]|jgi:GNAT superfamily N-acetyltransferase|nr:GNAT family N-acetyltransferase [Methylomirabilota bacterium]